VGYRREIGEKKLGWEAGQEAKMLKLRLIGSSFGRLTTMRYLGIFTTKIIDIGGDLQTTQA